MTDKSATPRTDAAPHYGVVDADGVVQHWYVHEDVAKELESELATARSSGNGGTCGTCGFRYFDYKGHLIPCPVCELAEAMRELEIKDKTAHDFIIASQEEITYLNERIIGLGNRQDELKVSLNQAEQQRDEAKRESQKQHDEWVEITDRLIEQLKQAEQQRDAANGQANANWKLACKSQDELTEAKRELEAACEGQEHLIASKEVLQRRLAEAEKDAERYRWLRLHSTQPMEEWSTHSNPESLDRAVDVAIAQEKK